MNDSNPIALLSEAFDAIQAENVELRESVAEVRALLSAEDQGWQILQGFHAGDRFEGLDLDEVHDIIRMLQPRVTAASLTKRAVDLHTGHVFGKGLTISGTEKPSGRGAKPGQYLFFMRPENQASLFSPSAYGELQKARFVEGNVLAACNTRSKVVNLIPFSQIVGVKTDPDFPTRVLAYRRQWTYSSGSTSEVRSRWYVTPRYPGARPASFGEGSERVPVDQDTVVVDLAVNRQPGFVLGVPDGIAGLHWAEAYTQHVRFGQTVTEGLAKLIFKITNKSKAQVQNSAVKVSNAAGFGNAVSMSEGQDVQAISTAGNAYKFAELQPIAALAAAAWNVSTADLLNNSSAAGSSYGALSALAPGNRNAMTLMQQQWSMFFQDVFEVMGFERPDVHWDPIEAPDPYRASQALTLLSTTLTDEEYRYKALDILDLTGDPRVTPPTLAMRSQPAAPAAAAQQAAPDQGVANGANVNGSSGSNDLRSDTISSQESVRNMRNEDLVNRLEDLLIRLENTGA